MGTVHFLTIGQRHPGRCTVHLNPSPSVSTVSVPISNPSLQSFPLAMPKSSVEASSLRWLRHCPIFGSQSLSHVRQIHANQKMLALVFAIGVHSSFGALGQSLVRSTRVSSDCSLPSQTAKLGMVIDLYPSTESERGI